MKRVVVATRIVSAASRIVSAASLALLLAMLTIAITACGRMETVSGRTMGTSYAVEARCPEGAPAEAIAAVLADVNGQMSTYDENSELSAFNRLSVGVPMPVSAGLAEVATLAQRVAAQTDGAFDATVAPLVALWGFGAGAALPPSEAMALRSPTETELQSPTEMQLQSPTEMQLQSPTEMQLQSPTEMQLQSARASVGYRRIHSSIDPPTLRKLAPATLDFSAVAKGHAVDRIAALLDRRACSDYLIELGGEVRVRGASASGKPWRIGIESPDADGLAGWLSMLDGAVATSGDYRQSRPLGGAGDGRVSHIIDPRTGRPIRHRLASVTVVADTAMLADAYATALLVLGERKGLAFAERRNLAAVFIRRTEAGYAIDQTTAMAAYRTERLP